MSKEEQKEFMSELEKEEFQLTLQDLAKQGIMISTFINSIVNVLRGTNPNFNEENLYIFARDIWHIYHKLDLEHEQKLTNLKLKYSQDIDSIDN